ncbi:MAG: crotonase/enoyl-CoA hydratase family protein [Pseudomonadota bacterium]
MDGRIDVELEAGVLSLRMNRPEKKNALTDAMYHALADAMEGAESDDEVGAILLLGAGGNFTTGNDIADFLAAAQGGGLTGERGVNRFLMAQVEGTKPLVAAVEGLAVGVGATTLLQCDLVYAAESADIRTPFVDLGLVPENASSLLGPRIMGHPKAFELLALGEPFDARRAYDAGIANRVVPAAELEAVARDAAARLAAKPREALAITRRLLRGDPEAVKAVSVEESRLFAERILSEEARSAFMGFMNRKAG